MDKYFGFNLDQRQTLEKLFAELESRLGGGAVQEDVADLQDRVAALEAAAE
jgi:hypothetical protein